MYLVLILICISLMASYIEHVFMCLFAIHISFIAEVSVKIFYPFFSWNYTELLGCHNKIPKTRWLKQQKFIISQFWKLEVQDQGVSRFDFF